MTRTVSERYTLIRGVSFGRSNLSSVELLSAEVVQLLWGELGSDSGRGDFVRLLDEGCPDLRFCFLAQLVVLDAQVDAALDRLVEDGDSVCGQYHYALEVF